jgi:hypothetical protein
MGKSGSGKSRLFTDLCTYFKPFKRIISHTTRNRRCGEVDIVDYYFDTDKELEIYKNDGKIIEIRNYKMVTGEVYYYTIENDLYDNRFKYGIVVVTPDMLELIYDNTMIKYPEFNFSSKFVGIYLNVDDSDTLTRSIQREKLNKNPRYDEICRRFISERETYCENNINRIFSKIGSPKVYNVLNDDYNDCITNAKKIISSNI